MNVIKQMLQLSTKQKLQLSKEGVEYIASIIPPAVSHISPDISPEVAAIFATAIKSTCFNIIDKASEFLNEGVDIRNIDVDWRSNFFDNARIVQDNEMQSLWAKILASEANTPGTYSKRSVNFVADMDKQDAEMFTHLCRYVCEIKRASDNIVLAPVIFNDTPPDYLIGSADLNHMSNIGMIRFANIEDNIDLHTQNDRIYGQKPMEVRYHEKCIHLAVYPIGHNRIEYTHLPIGNVRFTQIGRELYPICGSEPVDGFFDYICYQKWLPFIARLDKAAAAKVSERYNRTWHH